MPSDHQIFLLSPANCSGKRASLLLSKNGRSLLSRRLRSSEGATLGEVFTFMSSLYFRGKLAYAAAFAKPPDHCPGVQVIVPGLGLRSPQTPIDLGGLRAIARVRIDLTERRYTVPLRRDATQMAGQLAPEVAVVLLGSVATPKYLQPLREILGPRLRFPQEFVGLGDMSRGGLLLRCVAQGQQLTYIESVPASGGRAPEPAGLAAT